MEYKLIAMDFDGTLLKDDKTISQKTKERLKTYKDLGYMIVGVTARTLNSAKDVVPLDIFNYIIINNGASIYNVKTDKILASKEIPFEIAKKITEKLESHCIQIDFITEKNYNIYINKKKSNLDFIKDINTIDDLNEPIARINLFLKNNEDIEKCYEIITSNYNDVNCFIMQDSGDEKKWLVINPKNVNKASTLKELGEMKNISLSEMIYFGDGLNDLEVLQEVGLSVAMGNALEQVKKCTIYSTKTNNEDGIIDFLDKKLNRQKVKK